MIRLERQIKISRTCKKMLSEKVYNAHSQKQSSSDWVIMFEKNTGIWYFIGNITRLFSQAYFMIRIGTPINKILQTVLYFVNFNCYCPRKSKKL